MKRLENQDIINTYVKLGRIQYESILSGKYTKVNKYSNKVQKMLRYLKENIEVAKKIFPQLLKNESINVKGIASAHCLILGIYIEEAERILQEIASDKENGILGFEAEMTLKVWKEGNLRIAKKNKKGLNR